MIRSVYHSAQMNPKRLRPIGVTLLAVAFLWIGCIGTLIFPIIALAGGGSELWRLIAGKAIHSDTVLRATSYVFGLIWFLLYVAYAIIGFGLWKLRDWARKSVLAINLLGIAAGFLCALIFARPAAFAVAIMIGTVVPFGWFAWYLIRPRVRFAFGAWPAVGDSTATEEPPPGLSRRGKVFVGLLLAASLASYVAVLAIAVENMIRSSDIYRIAVTDAQNSPCASEVVGNPLAADWGVGGDLSEGGEGGSAELRIPIHGPRGKGSLDLSAEKASGKWKINSLALLRGSDRYLIVPSAPDGSCQVVKP